MSDEVIIVEQKSSQQVEEKMELSGEGVLYWDNRNEEEIKVGGEDVLIEMIFPNNLEEGTIKEKEFLMKDNNLMSTKDKFNFPAKENDKNFQTLTNEQNVFAVDVLKNYQTTIISYFCVAKENKENNLSSNCLSENNSSKNFQNNFLESKSNFEQSQRKKQKRSEENFFPIRLVKNSLIIRTKFEFDQFKKTIEESISNGMNINQIHPQSRKIPIQFIHPCTNKFFLWKILNFLIEKGSCLLHQSKYGSILHSLKSLSCDIHGIDKIEIVKIAKYILIRSFEMNSFCDIHKKDNFHCKKLHNQMENIQNINNNNNNNNYHLHHHYHNDKLQQNSVNKWKEMFVESVIDPTPPLLKVDNNGIRLKINDSSLKYVNENVDGNWFIFNDPDMQFAESCLDTLYDIDEDDNNDDDFDIDNS